ncbi:MAG: GPW/gp25 family protein [Cyanobacteria bacterium J06560_6]
MPQPINYDEYKHLGKGVAFPINIDLQGELQLSRALLSIEEAIRLILGTQLGERLYRPDFGSRLSELVFSPLNTDTLLKIKLHVESAIRKWEPRIVLHEIITEPDATMGMVSIHIRYFPKDTHDLRSFVYPFYLSVTQE